MAPTSTRRWRPFPDAKALTKGEYVDQLTGDIDSLLAIFYVLLALAVIVSLFGIVNTLVLSTFERTRELGMLRAVGMSRRQVRRMVRHESIITALIGAGMGIAAGLGLAAVVTSLFADEGLTFAVPAGALGRARRGRGDRRRPRRDPAGPPRLAAGPALGARLRVAPAHRGHGKRADAHPGVGSCIFAHEDWGTRSERRARQPW